MRAGKSIKRTTNGNYLTNAYNLTVKLCPAPMHIKAADQLIVIKNYTNKSPSQQISFTSKELASSLTHTFAGDTLPPHRFVRVYFAPLNSWMRQ